MGMIWAWNWYGNGIWYGNALGLVWTWLGMAWSTSPTCMASVSPRPGPVHGMGPCWQTQNVNWLDMLWTWSATCLTMVWGRPGPGDGMYMAWAWHGTWSRSGHG